MDGSGDRRPGAWGQRATGGHRKPAHYTHTYMVWANFFKVIPALGNYTVQFSRTSDGGATWSPPVVISDPGPFGIDQAPRLACSPTEPCW